MSQKETFLSRRNSLKLGLGALGAVTTSAIVAETCGPRTGEQPLGPFFPNAGTPTRPIRENRDPNVPLHLANDNDLTYISGQNGEANGQQVYVKGVVTNSNCEPIANATVIIWQASHSGKYNHNGDSNDSVFRHPKTGALIRRKLDESFQFWGNATTDANGEYLFKTIVPGFYPADLRGGWYRPPHIHFMVTATGHPQFVTQMYFAGAIENEAFVDELNGKDYLLQAGSISDDQRQKLVVKFEVEQDSDFAEVPVGLFDIQLPSLD